MGLTALELEELCPLVEWADGMVAITPRGLMRLEGRTAAPFEAIPALKDPCTVGRLLYQARKAWKDEKLRTRWSQTCNGWQCISKGRRIGGVHLLEGEAVAWAIILKGREVRDE